MSNRTSSTQRRTANLLGALAGEISDRLIRMHQEHPNQTDSSIAALNLIAASEGLSNAALSVALKLSHPATVRLVAKLKDDGLIEVKDALDKRAVAIYISSAGRQRIKRMHADRGRVLSDALRALSPDEQHQLQALLEKMLPPLVTDAKRGEYICRLCDYDSCPETKCPVHIACESG
jgi:MarR family transcriptional regulator, negative regulator of the multidrug operon emrRAB